jgi:hypothetical protein
VIKKEHEKRRGGDRSKIRKRKGKKARDENKKRKSFSPRG